MARTLGSFSTPWATREGLVNGPNRESAFRDRPHLSVVGSITQPISNIVSFDGTELPRPNDTDPS